MPEGASSFQEYHYQVIFLMSETLACHSNESPELVHLQQGYFGYDRL